MRHHVSKLLPYTPEQLFQLVGDVDAYPQFVPWINAMRTWNPRSLSEGVDAVDAEAGVGFSFLKERFSTRVRRDARNRQIDVSLISGPFKKLDNRWRFLDAGHGCTRVEFDIDFAFQSRLLEALLTANFAHAVDKLMTCFEARAKALYGQAEATADVAPAAVGEGSGEAA
ncbi:type II toxin-antitoxin system RatA family toxin [Phenylobacterium hankyongense]|uniref:Type II toxin-antitoxin system RatA family toxin n=1 Tax=Phenylobacterium hankyongense TaxID=1813876 RepID=A0A328B2L6_9CAUL|nr:type II toxin-antitoxin system RatA family toxin [Phenylobacterium hankyongense]RAK61159.1 type II toxin-antitoxin system RatA family toxin [Phenylobacterium hankyongense]